MNPKINNFEDNDYMPLYVGKADTEPHYMNVYFNMFLELQIQCQQVKRKTLILRPFQQLRAER